MADFCHFLPRKNPG